MKTIPFDIKYREKIESGEVRVVDTKGHPKKIVCWELDKVNPTEFAGKKISAYSINDPFRALLAYNEKGIFDGDPDENLMIDVDEVSEEFREAVIEKVRNIVSKALNFSENVTSKEYLNHFAWEIFTLAKADIIKDLPKWRETWDTYLPSDKYNITKNNLLVKGKMAIPISELERLPKEYITCKIN